MSNQPEPQRVVVVNRGVPCATRTGCWIIIAIFVIVMVAALLGGHTTG